MEKYLLKQENSLAAYSTAIPGRQEKMIDHFREQGKRSIRRICTILGFRRQTYYKRKNGHRPEELDEQIADLLHRVTKRFVAWVSGWSFHYLRNKVIPGTISAFTGFGKPKSCITPAA